MFDALRKMILPIIITVLFFFVGMIILEWGMGLTSRGNTTSASVAAVVNGEDVSWTDFNIVYDNMLRAESNNFEDEVTPEKRVELRSSAYNQILHDRLLGQEIAKLNMVVTDNELYSYLRLTPPLELQSYQNFQKNGQFDYQLYFSAMTDPNYAQFWASVETAVRPDILRLKLQEMIIQTAHVTESEIKEFYMDDAEQVKVGIIDVNYDRFSRPPPTHTLEEMKEWHESHKEDYPMDERASLRLVIAEKKAAPRDWETSYNRSMEIVDSIKAGGDFAELAVTFSEDRSSADGGDLGWFPEGQMVDEFDKKVFNMKKGDVSEPIRSQFGWHIIKLHDTKEEKEVPRGQTEEQLVKKVHASHILLKPVVSQETLDAAYIRLEQLLNDVGGNDLIAAAKENNLSVRPTAMFFKGKTIQFVGSHPLASQLAFNGEIDEISGILESKTSYFVAQVASRLPAGLATFEDVEDRVNQDLQKHKVKTLCNDAAAVIWTEIENGASIEDAAKNNGSEYVVLDPFKRSSFVKELRRDPNAMGAAFGLTKPGELSGPIDHSQGTVIFKLIERISPGLTEFTAKRDSIKSSIQVGKQQELYGRWIKGLLDNSEITNNVETTVFKDEDYL